MKLHISVVIILVLIAAQTCLSAERHLRGCHDPGPLSKALTNLQQNNWNKISCKQVLSTWPSRLDELKCESETGCRILLSRDRVISGHCECCEAFEFDMERTPDGSPGEHLSDIIFHYSDPDRNYVVDAAKRLAEAVGLPQVQVPGIGGKPVERFYWDDAREALRQSYTLELHLSRVGQNWELYFYILAVPI